MNNIQKDFKLKSKLRGMADGGVAQTANTLRGRRAQIDAAVDAASGLPPAPPPQGQQPQQQPPAEKPPEKGALRSFFGLADGGGPRARIKMADDGLVEGEGGPTEDAVGPLALSDGEYVLPADTVDIVGRKNLDMLRLATHNFVDEGEKKSVLRGMANGGPVNPNQLELDFGGKPKQLELDFGDTPKGPPSPTGPTPPVEPASGGTSGLRKVLDVGVGASKGMAKTAGAGAMLAGAAQSLDDMRTGYRDSFIDSVGANTPLGSVAADTARTFGNIGNMLTFGYADKIGRGLSSAVNGGTFMGGFNAEGDRARFERQNQTPPVLDRVASTVGDIRDAITSPAPVAPAPARDPAATGGAAGQKPRGVWIEGDRVNVDDGVNKGYVSGLTPEQAARVSSSLRDPSRINTISFAKPEAGNGGGQANESSLRRPGATDEAAAINERFDKMARQLSSMYGPKGQGNLARRLLELEQLRAGALAANAKNMTDVRGQDISADAASKAAEREGLRAAAAAEERRQARQDKLDADFEKRMRENQETQYKRGNDTVAAAKSAVTTQAKGDDDKEQEYDKVVSTIPGKWREQIKNMDPASRAAAYNNILDAYDTQNRGTIAGRAPAAVAQNAVVGGLIGSTLPGVLGKVGAAGDLAARVATRGRYKGSVLRNVLGSRLLNAGAGAAIGAGATPKVEVPDRLNMPEMDSNGEPMRGSPGLRDIFKYGAIPLYNPSNDVIRMQNQGLWVGDMEDNDLANYKDLYRGFGK